MNEIMAILPATIRSILTALPSAVREHLEEIRLRQNQPLEIRFGQQSSYVTAAGQLTANARQGWTFTEEQSVKLLNLVSQHSLYTLEEELKRGYITVTGGHRIGIAGKVVLEREK